MAFLKKISLGVSAILLMTVKPSLAQSWVDNNLSVEAAKVGEVFPPLPDSPLTGDWGSNQQHVYACQQ